ncbi:phytanoyl-CoA dioxygenase family protein [Streptomyces litchfieldiae]|uniref:Phytanoyl-CoA dioxygenase family protein n=1 Tax=Streptomyces litchfieldiae TaxID=3075543 RepID=A0ABU2MQP5_9ACTN|nr:phytanoyl-CoA dioxygenase family protein [Streptomyces sp. DSM 44938]MDT0343938.1 phytanoyl-CoA dioxygenase family protein [Streptomyces sp. DSM 44938]
MVRLEAVERATARADYARDGWYAPGTGLDPALLDSVRHSIEEMSRMERPEVVYEAGSRTVRALHGCHRYNDVCARLIRHPLLVDLAETLLGEEVYVYQFKVNIKSPREGKQWPWHQDYAFWAREDGMPTPNAVSIAINIDDVHEHNGPLTVLPGSHRHDLIDASKPPEPAGRETWHAHVSAKLSHTVPDARVRRLTEECGTTTLVGPAGTLIAFHPNLVHSSSDNLSPDRRAVLLITYNAVRNAPTRLTRPDFLVDPDTTRVRPMAWDGPEADDD